MGLASCQKAQGWVHAVATRAALAVLPTPSETPAPASTTAANAPSTGSKLSRGRRELLMLWLQVLLGRLLDYLQLLWGGRLHGGSAWRCALPAHNCPSFIANIRLESSCMGPACVPRQQTWTNLQRGQKAPGLHDDAQSKLCCTGTETCFNVLIFCVWPTPPRPCQCPPAEASPCSLAEVPDSLAAQG